MTRRDIITDLRAASAIANERGVSALVAFDIATDARGVPLESLRYLAGLGTITIRGRQTSRSPEDPRVAEALLDDAARALEEWA